MKKPAATKTQFALLPPVQRSRLKVQGSRFPGVSAILYPLSSIVLATALLCGCTGPRALKGGRALTARTPGGSVSQVLLQGENPSAASRQAQETVKVRTYTMPAGSRIEQPPFVAADLLNAPTLQRSNAPTVFVLAAPTPVAEREETRSHTELGAAQKDTARELGAKLSSLKGLVWVGIVMFVFGIASFAWPPLKAIIGSVTTSAAIILGGVAVAVGAWFLAHRHGRLHGQLAASTHNARPFWHS